MTPEFFPLSSAYVTPSPPESVASPVLMVFQACLFFGAKFFALFPYAKNMEICLRVRISLYNSLIYESVGNWF